MRKVGLSIRRRWSIAQEDLHFLKSADQLDKCAEEYQRRSLRRLTVVTVFAFHRG